MIPRFADGIMISLYINVSRVSDNPIGRIIGQCSIATITVTHCVWFNGSSKLNLNYHTWAVHRRPYVARAIFFFFDPIVIGFSNIVMNLISKYYHTRHSTVEVLSRQNCLHANRLKNTTGLWLSNFCEYSCRFFFVTFKTLNPESAREPMSYFIFSVTQVNFFYNPKSSKLWFNS